MDLSSKRTVRPALLCAGLGGKQVLPIKNWQACSIFARQTFHFHSLGGSTAYCCMKGHHVKNLTPWLDAYLREEHSCQISSRSVLKRRSLRLFWRGSPQKNNNKNNKNKLSSDMRSVPDRKNETGCTVYWISISKNILMYSSCSISYVIIIISTRFRPHPTQGWTQPVSISGLYPITLDPLSMIKRKANRFGKAVCTRSSPTAEKQRVSYACLSRLANWSCNSLHTADVVN